MPIVYENEVSSTVIAAVWHISESLEELLPGLSKVDRGSIGEAFVEKKKLETAAARLTLSHLMSKAKQPYEGIQKDEYGKPHLANEHPYHISISHAHPYAAAIIDKSGPTGIDIEAVRPQIERIKHKFLSKDELHSQSDLSTLTKFWCAKECLYKIYGRRSLIFSRDLQVELAGENKLLGRVLLDNQSYSYKLRLEKIADHWLVYKCNELST